MDNKETKSKEKESKRMESEETKSKEKEIKEEESKEKERKETKSKKMESEEAKSKEKESKMESEEAKSKEKESKKMESEEAKSKEKESKKMESEEAKSKEKESKDKESKETKSKQEMEREEAKRKAKESIEKEGKEMKSKKMESKEAEAQKALSKAVSQVSKLKEEVKNEREKREWVEEEMQDLEQELEGLRTELMETVEATAAQTKLRSSKEAELSKLQQRMEEETRRHELKLSELGNKHSAAIKSLKEQLDDSKQAYQSLQKAKAVLEEERNNLTSELKSLQISSTEIERGCKRARDQLKVLRAHLAQVDREKVEREEHMHRLQCENQSLTDKLSSSDTNSLRLCKEFSSLESQLHDTQKLLHNETQQKLALGSLVRTLEEERKGLMEQKEEEEERTKDLTQQIQTHTVKLEQLREQLEVAESAAVDRKESCWKLQRELDSAIQREQQKEEEKGRLEKQRERLSEDLEDMTMLFERERENCAAMEKKLKKFDLAKRCLTEEKVLSARLVEERDRAEADIREKETRHLALSRELKEAQDQREALEMANKQLQAEMEKIVNQQDIVVKNVHELERTRRALETDVKNMRTEMQELEEDLTEKEQSRLTLVDSLQELKAQFEREISSSEAKGEEKRRALIKQVRDLEIQLEDEKSLWPQAVFSRKQLEAELQEAKAQVEASSRGKEEAMQLLRKLQGQMKEILQERDETNLAREEVIAHLKVSEKKIKNLQAEVLQVTEELSVSDRQKRQAQQERNEIADEMFKCNAGKTVLISEKQRLLTFICQLEGELEEEQTNSEMLAEKERKAVLQVESLTNQLQGEKAKTKEKELALEQLEKSKKELKRQLGELKEAMRGEHQLSIANLKAKIESAEEQLEQEKRERATTKKLLWKSENKLREMMMQAVDERRHADQYREQLDKSTVQLKQLKVQLEEMEGEKARSDTQKRKLQRELEEINETSKSMTREIITLRSQLRCAPSPLATCGHRVQVDDLGMDSDLEEPPLILSSGPPGTLTSGVKKKTE